MVTMKTLKFHKSLVKLVLNKEKTITWRLFDDKDLSKGDIVSCLVWETKEEFAKARIIEVNKKKFRDLKFADKDGHENFSSDEEMYKTYSKYYRCEITPENTLKIIKFELI
jgi:hypothetical protein